MTLLVFFLPKIVQKPKEKVKIGRLAYQPTYWQLGCVTQPTTSKRASWLLMLQSNQYFQQVYWVVLSYNKCLIHKDLV